MQSDTFVHRYVLRLPSSVEIEMSKSINLEQLSFDQMDQRRRWSMDERISVVYMGSEDKGRL